MNDRNLRCILGQTNDLYAKKEFSNIILRRKITLRTLKYSHIPPGFTEVLTKMPFYPIEAMEFQKFVYTKKETALICICDMKIGFSLGSESQKVNKEKSCLFLCI